MILFDRVTIFSVNNYLTMFFRQFLFFPRIVKPVCFFLSTISPKLDQEFSRAILWSIQLTIRGPIIPEKRSFPHWESCQWRRMLFKLGQRWIYGLILNWLYVVKSSWFLGHRLGNSIVCLWNVPLLFPDFEYSFL